MYKIIDSITIQNQWQMHGARNYYCIIHNTVKYYLMITITIIIHA